MLSVGVAQEKERRPAVGRRMVQVGNLRMDLRTARIMANVRREQEEQIIKKRAALEVAKRSGKKNTLDVERFLRATSVTFSRSEEEIQQMLADRNRVERIEMEYYLDTPSEVVNLGKYIEWVISLLG